MNQEKSIFLSNSDPLEKRFKAEDILFLTNLNESLSNADTESVYDELTLMIQRYIDIEELKVYHFNLNTQSFRLKIYIGEDPEPERSFLLSKNPQLAQAIFYNKAVRCYSHPNLYYMFLKVNDIPIAFIEAKTFFGTARDNKDILLFEGLVNFAGRILENNKPVSELHSHSFRQRIISREDFEEKLSYEKRRNHLFGTKYSLVSLNLSLKDFDYIKEKIPSIIRETDFVTYDFRTEKIYFLLPCTPESRKEAFQRRVIKFLIELEII